MVWSLLVVGPVGRFVVLAGFSWLSAVSVGLVERFVVLLFSFNLINPMFHGPIHFAHLPLHLHRLVRPIRAFRADR